MQFHVSLQFEVSRCNHFLRQLLQADNCALLTGSGIFHLYQMLYFGNHSHDLGSSFMLNGLVHFAKPQGFDGTLLPPGAVYDTFNLSNSDFGHVLYVIHRLLFALLFFFIKKQSTKFKNITR